MPHNGVTSDRFQTVHDSKQSAKHWRPFGCRAVGNIPISWRKGLTPLGEIRILLAVLELSVYLVMLSCGNIGESRHVKLSEKVFPGLLLFPSACSAIRLRS